MRKSEIRRFQPLGPLKILQVSSHSVRLRSSREVLELSALAPNLFRVRLARGKELLGHRSWAVVKTDWKTTPTVIRARNSGVTIETQSGKLSMRTSDGSWKLTDVSENEVFCAIPRKTGFEGHECQLLLRLTEEEALFGLGETTGTFNKRGLHRVFWNIDVLGHAPAIHPSLQSLYLSIPFCISIREGRAAGLFWDNPARQSWDLGQTKSDEWEMRAASGEIDLYLFLGPQVSDVVSGFTELTGRMPLPPRWALGYHQCRYSYESRARVEAAQSHHATSGISTGACAGA